MRFRLNGVEHDLDARTVIARTRGVPPEPVQTHGVRIDGVVFPVKQAYELATGVSRTQFTSHTALRHLGSLGFAALGHPQARGGAASTATTAGAGAGLGSATTREWPWEGAVREHGPQQHPVMPAPLIVVRLCIVCRNAEPAFANRHLDRLRCERSH